MARQFGVFAREGADGAWFDVDRVDLLRPCAKLEDRPYMAVDEPDAADRFRLKGRDRISVRAVFLGARLDLRALEIGERLADAPLTVAAGDRGAAVLFRYGAAVFFDVSPIPQASLTSQLEPLVSEAFDKPEYEEAQVQIKPNAPESVRDGVIQVTEITLERVQIIADILAKSVVLAHYENTIAAVFDRVEPLAVDLETRARSGHSSRELLRHIGGALRVETNMVARVEVTEKPDLLWEKPSLELLYGRLEDEYELEDRHAALERKLALISRTAETMLELIHTQRNLRLEWYIVILILVEIVLMVFGMLLR